jgi:hypothetical protein
VNVSLLGDRYLLLDELGRGGMATVYRAFDRVRQRIVAIKLQSSPEPAGPAHPLSSEFDAWSRLRHPNIARVIDLQVTRNGPGTRGAPFLVLEQARGLPADRALQPGRAPCAVVEGFAVQTLRALRHVHAAGLVHRDIKPSNLIADVTGRRLRQVKLIDFGLAARQGTREEPGRLSGSLPFVSPEALLGLPLDGRADLYGLGIVLHLLLAGRLPAPSRDVESLLRWHLVGCPADPARSRPAVPPRLRRLIHDLTERDPSSRPAGADEALALLGAAPDGRRTDRSPADGRGARAALRLALDAARLGSRRPFPLPRPPRLAAELLREARVWSRTRGIGFHRLQTGATGGRRSLGGMLLRLLLDRGEPARRLARRHGLEDWVCPGLLPSWAAGPVRGKAGRPVAREGPLRRRRAEALVRFMLACSGSGPLVVALEMSPRQDALAAAVAEALRRAAGRRQRAARGTPGLLVLERESDPVSSASGLGSSGRD